MRVLFLSGPKPPPSALGFCVICSGIWKHAAYAPVAADVDASATQQGDGEAVFALRADHLRAPQPAVCWGFFAPFMGPPVGSGFYPGLMPLCWTHLMMLEDRNSSIIPAAASQLPPEHLRGGVFLDRS